MQKDSIEALHRNRNPLVYKAGLSSLAQVFKDLLVRSSRRWIFNNIITRQLYITISSSHTTDSDSCACGVDGRNRVRSDTLVDSSVRGPHTWQCQNTRCLHQIITLTAPMRRHWRLTENTAQCLQWYQLSCYPLFFRRYCPQVLYFMLHSLHIPGRPKNRGHFVLRPTPLEILNRSLPTLA